MDKFLNFRAALFTVAALLAAFGVGNAFVAIFSQGKYEVIYQFDEKIRYCAGGHCFYSADLAIANTGHEFQEQVRVELSGLPTGVHGAPTVLNLSAAEPRTADPEIAQHYGKAGSWIQITQFAPGTLIQFRFWGSYSEGGAPDSGAASVTVSARGRRIEGDPRAITLGRYLTCRPTGDRALDENRGYFAYGSV